MSGQDYLQDIKNNLQAGRNQHRMGENILRAFGYVRRRKTAIDEINSTLDELGLETYPPITSDMPLRVPRIIFSLKHVTRQAPDDSGQAADDPENDGTSHTAVQLQNEDEEEPDDDYDLPEPAFSISELASANTDVQRVSQNASIQEAYTTMLRHKYSQLVVANSDRPRRQDIKGIVSYQSIAKALMNGEPKTVRDCIDDDMRFAQSDADLNSIVSELDGSDVVLVLGRDHRLQGIVTAWDLAEEFAVLVDPFKKIGEIEERLRALVERRLGKDHVAEFLSDQDSPRTGTIEELDELTMGELQRVLENPENWNKLGLVFDRSIFVGTLNEAREYRNRLMHFRDPLTDIEMTQLTNFCDMVREIKL